MTTVRQCARCGAVLDEYSPAGVCPRCLGRSVLEPIEGEPLGALTSSTDAPAPRRFADYELLEEIARGGMGVVYRARQVSLNRVVAVKMILSGPFSSAVNVERFRAEAKAAATLQHPNIVAIHDVGEHEGLPYYSMDFVAGRNLAAAARDGPLPPKRAAHYLKIIAEAIHYAHQQGVLHRDLKPSNILIDRADQPRITDFGLAKRLTGDSDLTLSGQVLGSPNFMPPEQAAGRRSDSGPWSDVYSLGAILYHLVTGRAPYQAATVTDTLQQVLNNEPASPRLVNPSVPRDLETMCLKCLQKEPARRYQTAQALADELGRFLDGEPIRARPIGPLEKLWRWCRRKPALAGALSAALLLLLLVAIGSPIVAFQMAQQRQRAEEDLYVSNIRSAAQAIEANNLMSARESLRMIDPSPHQRSLRGWEWRHLVERCRSQDIGTLCGHDAWLAGVEFSPDDKLLASISEDGVVKLWDWELRKPLASWQAHLPPATQRPVNRSHSVAFSPDGLRLITGGADGFVHFWNLATGEQEFTLDCRPGRIGSIGFSPDGGKLACSSNPDRIFLWDVSGEKPEPLAHWKNESSFVLDLAFLPDGRSIVATGDRVLRRWDISNPRQPRPLPSLRGTERLAVSPDGRWLVSSPSGAGGLSVWTLPQCEEAPDFPNLGSAGYGLSFSTDGKLLANGGADGNITILNVAGRRSVRVLHGHTNTLSALAFSHTGRILASASCDCTVRLWDVGGIERPELSLNHGIKVQDVRFLKDSSHFVTLGKEQRTNSTGKLFQQSTVKLWNAAKRLNTATGVADGAPINNCLAIAPDESMVAANDTKHIRLFALRSLQSLTNYPGQHLAYSADGRTMVYADADRLLRRRSWSEAPVQVGRERKDITHVAVSPDGKTAVTRQGESEGAFTFWDVEQHGAPVVASQHQQPVVQFVFSPDGVTMASASWDATVGIWDVASRRLSKLLRGQSAAVHTAAFSPDGRTLATGAEDGTVRLWNLRTLREMAALSAQPGGVTALGFSPDGQWLVVGGWDGTVRLWHAPSWDQIAAAHESK